MEDWQRRRLQNERRKKRDEELKKKKEQAGLLSSSRSTQPKSKQSSMDQKRLKEAKENAAADRGLRLIREMNLKEMNLKMKRTCFVDSSTLFSSSPRDSFKSLKKPLPKKASPLHSFYSSDSDQEFTRQLEEKKSNPRNSLKLLKKPSPKKPKNSFLHYESDEEYAMLGAKIEQEKIEKQLVSNVDWKETKSKKQPKSKRKSVPKKNFDSDEDSIDSMDRKPRAKPDLFKGRQKHDSDSYDSMSENDIPMKSITVHKKLDDDDSYDGQEDMAKQKRHVSPNESFKRKSPKARTRQVRREVSSDDSDTEEDMMAYSRRMRNLDKKAQYSSSEGEEEEVQSEQSRSPKNQGGRDKKEHKRKSSSNRSSKSKSKPSPVKQKPDDLWSDDDVVSSASSIQDDKSTSAMNDWDAAVAYINKSPSPVKKKRNKKQTKKKVRPSKEFDYDSEVDEFADEAALEQELKPHFENPKWLSECIPLPLKNPLAEQDGEGDQEQGGDAAADMKHSIPASINRYLKVYQQEGVRFIYKLLMQGYGSVLGDDMGLGKTVQIIALIAALQNKKGNKCDLKEIRERQEAIMNYFAKVKADQEDTLLRGGIIAKTTDALPELPYSPILVIVPPLVFTNWEKEFKTWGYFAVASYRDANRAIAIERISCGMEDIMLCGSSMLKKEKDLNELLTIQWSLIIVDEFHDYKNHTTKLSKALETLRNASQCPIVGMTGTIMSNEYQELYNLIDIVQPGLLGERTDFRRDYARPLHLLRPKDSKPDVLALGNARNEELKTALKNVFLKREKSMYLEDDLPTKKQKIVFCELSELQKELYQHIIYNLTEYQFLRTCNMPCDCGVNRKFFLKLRSLPTKAVQIEFTRQNKEKITLRKECCYTVPEGDDVVFWPAQHEDDKICQTCPGCITLPALQKLNLLASHASFLQVDKDPDHVRKESDKKKLKKDLAFAKVAIPKHLLKFMPGKSYTRKTSIFDDHSLLSGKMKVLSYFLRKFEKRGDRVLLFSYSTVTLDMIQHFIKEKGYSHLRIDGSVKNKQDLVDKYQENDDIFLFLISTKAGGVGLNLTAANKVIIFDVGWNPSSDEQAQDRSYRIGQDKDVEVIRFVSKGTIEEIKYMRQLYKVHLKQQTLASDEYTANEPPQIFRGVDKDKNRKGELFGIENLLKFKDGSFMEDFWKAAEAPKRSENDKEAIDEEDIVAAMNGAKENGMEKLFEDEDGTDDIENVVNNYFEKHKTLEHVDDSEEENEFEGVNYEDFLRKDKGGAALQEGDQGFYEEMGAFSQNVADAEMEFVDDNENSESVEKETRTEREINEVKLESKENDSRIQVKTEFDTSEMNTQECQTSLLAEIDSSIGYQYTPQCSQEGKKLLSSLTSAEESKIKEKSCNTETSIEKEAHEQTVASKRGHEIKGFPRQQDNEKKSKKSSGNPFLEKENEGLVNSENTVDDDIQTKTPKITFTSSPSRRSAKPTKEALGKKRKAETKSFSSKKFLHIPSYWKGK
ncbi:hypothetical protein CTEN210_04027 [Chaetoceros tenuissimus]|uniref:Uncharacterized protein n=1 Tax=Chaetoceros tenuissimus TaxID=426638 RepID=A0AAD3H1W8_9STRA|nr:hypothetical protein CTEN210_04027 [Chaetoceros tenuissimus]